MMSDASTWAYAVALFLLLLVIPGTITLLKGQVLLFVAGLFTLALVWTVASFRLAQPGSWWARRFYDEAKLARARRRYGQSGADSG
jgi:hypothetical protein